MARSYSGREWKCLLGIQTAAASVGSDTADANTATGTKVAMRVATPLNDFAWDAGYTRSEIERAGVRTFQANDIINHYGSGVWTWDFDYPVDSEVAIQNLLQLIYPANGATGTSLTIPYNPTVQDYSHGSTSGNDRLAVIILENPLADSDHYMHSAVLQTLNLSMDIGTNGGLLNASGQFMTGYKPIIEANTVTYDTTAATLPKTNVGTIYDLTTTTFGGSAVTIKSFSLNIDNPATRVGYKNASGEADGYTRGSAIKITGTVSMKADEPVQDFLVSKWQTNTTVAITMENAAAASGYSFSIPAANISAYTSDQADEGIFIDCAFTATAGSGAGNLAVIKVT